MLETGSHAELYGAIAALTAITDNTLVSVRFLLLQFDAASVACCVAVWRSGMANALRSVHEFKLL